MHYSVLICTAGTSIITNLRSTTASESFHFLKELLEKGDFQRLAEAMLDFNPAEKLLGAEINSIYSLLRKDFLQKREELYFLVSDTDEGREAGEILKFYFQHRDNPISFERVIIETIPGLRDDDVERFKNEGLKNLIKRIATIVREENKHDRTVINATAGYKAQAAFAALLGQALEIPVLYKFENFNEIIELPPQPLSLDFSFWLEHYDEFWLLSHYSKVEKEKVPTLAISRKAASLLKRERADNKEYISLTPMGHIFHETFDFRFSREISSWLPSKPSALPRQKPFSENKPPEELPLGALDFIMKVWEKKEYIKTITLQNINSCRQEEILFRFNLEHRKPELIYCDGKKSATFIIEIAGATEKQLRAAVVDLNNTFLRK